MIEDAKRRSARAGRSGRRGDDGLLDALSEGATAAAFDGNPHRLTELDALIAYLQMLGTLVDFADYTPRAAICR